MLVLPHSTHSCYSNLLHSRRKNSCTIVGVNWKYYCACMDSLPTILSQPRYREFVMKHIPVNVRGVVAGLWMGCLPLEVETERYAGAQYEQRICKLCKSEPIHAARARVGPPSANYGLFRTKPSSCHVHSTLQLTLPTSPCPTLSADAELACKHTETIFSVQCTL